MDTTSLLAARFGAEAAPDAADAALPEGLARLLDRRVSRRYRDQDVPEALLALVLAAAQSAPSKSDLQQYSVVVLRERAPIARIAGWIGTMDWIATAPVLLIWCGDMRRGQRLCARHAMEHANNNLDTFLNTAADCALAMGHAIAAAETLGLGTCPISYVRNHVEKIAPLLALPKGVYPLAGLTLGWPDGRRPTAMRLPPGVVVHRERYDDAAMEEAVAAYDRRRAAREPIAPGSVKNRDIYPARADIGWSENLARQLSVPERYGFAAWLRTRGFGLA
ncbi:MAG: nitroreductase family protein [Rhodospirillales bacterium]|nr:nitroreductase family protein [Rhodospirillales bacterium]